MPRHAVEIFSVFLRLGLTSFGGPVAHLEYFRREFVERRRWLTDSQYAQLLAISQFLPGPASSQLGFGIGWLRGGPWGALAAFTAFTLPSALLMGAVAVLGGHRGLLGSTALVHALKLVAAVVVLDGVLRMARSLTPDMTRLLMALAAALAVSVAGSAWMQLAVIAIAGLVGLALRTDNPAAAQSLDVHVPRAAQLVLMTLFALGTAVAMSVSGLGLSLGALAAAMWRAGALVFGGGHVVLPLLEASTVASGWMSQEAFLAGYGAAQLVPGPMFSLAAYLGALTPTGALTWLAAVVALLAVFVPGFLLLAAALPTWDRITAHPNAGRALAGVNAAVVGLLAAALFDPVLPAAIGSWPDLVVIAVAFTAQRLFPRPTFVVLALCLAGAVWTS